MTAATISKRVFSDWPSVTADPDFVQFVVEDFPVRLIGLDTLMPGRARERCANAGSPSSSARSRPIDKPVVIFMHHPPFDCGIAIWTASA